MTLREHMEYLVNLGDGGCESSFLCDECPFSAWNNSDICVNRSERVAQATQWLAWLKDHAYSNEDKSMEYKGKYMDKAEATKKLNMLNKEMEALREIIEREDKLVYDDRKMYVAVMYNNPYILAGYDGGKHFRWHSYRGLITETAWTWDVATGQEAIDEGQKSGKVYVFTDAREGFKFFLEHYVG